MDIEAEVMKDIAERKADVKVRLAIKKGHRKLQTRRRRRQADGNSNGYDQLEGEYLTYYMVASKHTTRCKDQDKEDLVQTIILTLALAERTSDHKPFTEGTMHRIASRTVADYWYTYYKVTNGLDCGHCSKAQRDKCKKDYLYSECSRAIKMESLNKPIIDSEGNITELGELIADPKSLDLAAWDMETNLWQLGYKPRLVDIALKLKAGLRLDKPDQKYLERYRKQEQLKLL